MRPWLLMLAGLAIWAAHFLGVYVIVSLEDLAWPQEPARWRLMAALFTGVCAAACAGALVLGLRYAAGRGLGPRRFMAQMGVVGAGLAFVAVSWQGLAVLIG